MSDNPLDNDPAREQRIRERAYHLWEADGSPHGRHEEYWERARELVGMEESGPTGQLPNPASDPHADVNQEQPVEEAFIQANLGEFPDRFADQGESQQTPLPDAKPRRKAPVKPRPPETNDPGPAKAALDKAAEAGKKVKASPPAAEKPKKKG